MRKAPHGLVQAVYRPGAMEDATLIQAEPETGLAAEVARCVLANPVGAADLLRSWIAVEGRRKDAALVAWAMGRKAVAAASARIDFEELEILTEDLWALGYVSQAAVDSACRTFLTAFIVLPQHTPTRAELAAQERVERAREQAELEQERERSQREREAECRAAQQRLAERTQRLLDRLNEMSGVEIAEVVVGMDMKVAAALLRRLPRDKQLATVAAIAAQA